MPRALIIDDDPDVATSLADWVRNEGFEAVIAQTLAAARTAMKEVVPDLLLVDMELPDGNGISILQDLEEHPDAEVVIITGHGTVDSAVEAMRGGAVDYIQKPVDTRRLRTILRNVKRTLGLRSEISDLRDELRSLGRFGDIIGASKPMQRVYDLIAKAAPTDATVFIVGETGTGKELVAQTIHRLSRRAEKPFLPINCGAVPDSLIESELFGHEKGSFTGAERTHRGIFERADGGTLLLDEVTEMPANLQTRLLRVLETQRVTRIGGDKAIDVDVRVIAASNREPRRAVEEGGLREDLMYRLLVFPIELPRLRDRRDDVEVLASGFLADLNRAADTEKRLSPEALESLKNHSWPGNVRELKNVIERAFIVSSDVIGPGEFPFEHAKAAPRNTESSLEFPFGTAIAEVERRMILGTLEHLDGDKKTTAERLGISLKTLYNRLKEYGYQKREPTG